MLHEIQDGCDGEPDSLFHYLTTGLGIAHSHANESWADEAIQMLENVDEEFTWSSDQAQPDMSRNATSKSESNAK